MIQPVLSFACAATLFYISANAAKNKFIALCMFSFASAICAALIGAIEIIGLP